MFEVAYSNQDGRLNILNIRQRNPVKVGFSKEPNNQEQNIFFKVLLQIVVDI